jgi:hypothetical protein
MAENQSQRPYRASEPPVRSQAKNPGSDPLAELARLIGQTDPFGEYGRGTGRAASPQPAELSDWRNQPAGSPYSEQRRAGGNTYYAGQQAPAEPRDLHSESAAYGRQPYQQQYGGQPTADSEHLYQTQNETRDYPASEESYQRDPYEQDAAQYAEEEYYEDAPPPKRRLAVTAIAGVIGLAVIGTAGAFGYRALFGSSASSQPPPVIKADAGPSKIVPAAAGKDAQSNKLISDRMNERGQSEKLVSREEQPIDRPAAVVLSQAVPQPAMGSGVVGSEPKKVRTIAIRPDQSVMADATAQAAAPLAPAAVTRPQAAAPAKPAPQAARTATTDSSAPDAEADSSTQGVRAAPAPRQAATGQPNAPLSLSPDSTPARAQGRPAQPTQTAAVAPQAAAPAPSTTTSPGSGSFVQLSSQRSEGEAQAAFRNLQAKYPDQLGGRDVLVHKVDLGTKGTYYRAMVGPFANANEANELCSSLKAAGAQCLIQRN